MYIVRPLPQFTTWLQGVRDAKTRAIIVARIRRVERGLVGDAEPVGGGVSELRIHHGAGWRVYYTQRGRQIIVLLAGGSKRTQASDVQRAKALAAMLE
ncbi:type II toxin-antitoxin system RelE/ParE family toxin [Herbaspirillum seropedicae]|uniref:type II toxin-antitoxin system RelE/ParE family toxin n=1 Tax=Herbaspirillum seropedicae TaxID=964 RepID=UPI003FCE1F47